MRKFIAIGVVLLLAIGLIVERGIDTEPAVSAEAATSVGASGQLSDLGPVTLITNEYGANVSTSCITLIGTSVYITSFTTAALGATGTITSAAMTPTAGTVSVSVAGGIVTVLGTFFGPCGGPIGSVMGSIDDGAVTHTYVANIST